MDKWLDYSAAKLGGATIKRAGYRGVLRYIDSPANLAGKHTNRSEYQSHLASGLGVLLVFEAGSGDADGGYAAGVANAKRAKAGADYLGYTGPIFFCNDKPTVNVAPWRSYLTGAASVLGKNRVGAYGFKNAVDSAMGYAVCFWQAGRQADVCGHTNVYQWNNGRAHVGGVECDVNYIYRAVGTIAASDIDGLLDGMDKKELQGLIADGVRDYFNPEWHDVPWADKPVSLRDSILSKHEIASWNDEIDERCLIDHVRTIEYHLLNLEKQRQGVELSDEQAKALQSAVADAVKGAEGVSPDEVAKAVVKRMSNVSVSFGGDKK